MKAEPVPPLELFYCYAHEDKAYRDALDIHLRGLKRQYAITTWYDGQIVPGTEWEREIDIHLTSAHLILLLVSPDFLASDYCYSVEMKQALERHKAGTARVIPIILRPAYWEDVPFSRLQVLPSGAKPISLWQDRDEAWQDVVRGIRTSLKKLITSLRLVEERPQENPPLEGVSEEPVHPNPDKTSPPQPLPRSSPVPGPSARPTVPFNGVNPISTATSFLTQNITRRNVVVGLTALVVAGGGVIWWADTRMSATGTMLKPFVPPIGTVLHIYKGRYLSQVGALAWSPDGTRIASGSYDGTVQVWDAMDGTHLYTYKGHTRSVYALAWSPDGTRIASGSRDYTVQVWDAVDGTHLYTYKGHSSVVHGVVWSPDSKRIASGGDDGTVQVWNAADGSHLYTYEGHTDKVQAVTWSPDSKRVASGSYDSTVQVWEATDGTPHLYTYKGHTNSVYTVAWSPDGTRVASGGDDFTVQVWNAANSMHLYTYKGHSFVVEALIWSSDSKRIASASADGTVQVWKAS